HAEGALPEMDLPARVSFLLQALRARVLALLVAPDAVVRLVQRAGKVCPLVGERESFAAANVVQRMHGIPALVRRPGRHEVHGVDALRRLEEHAVAMAP